MQRKSQILVCRAGGQPCHQARTCPVWQPGCRRGWGPAPGPWRNPPFLHRPSSPSAACRARWALSAPALPVRRSGPGRPAVLWEIRTRRLGNQRHMPHAASREAGVLGRHARRSTRTMLAFDVLALMRHLSGQSARWLPPTSCVDADAPHHGALGGSGRRSADTSTATL